MSPIRTNSEPTAKQTFTSFRQREKQPDPIAWTVDRKMIISREDPRNAMSEMRLNIEPEQKEMERSERQPEKQE
jgi:hypothetical protein